MKGIRKDCKNEHEVQGEILSYLTIANIYHWRNNTGAVKSGGRFIRYGYKGSSDILGICPDGRFLAIECKAEKNGKLSPDQVIFLGNIEKNGGVAIVANTVESCIRQLHEKNVIKE